MLAPDKDILTFEEWQEWHYIDPIPKSLVDEYTAKKNEFEEQSIISLFPEPTDYYIHTYYMSDFNIFSKDIIAYESRTSTYIQAVKDGDDSVFNEYQDKTYGKFNRIMNKKDSGGYVCTVCGDGSKKK
jgi:hypothetical protein